MSGIIVLTDSNFKKAVSEHKTCVIRFTAAWCGPCKIIAPIFNAVADAMSSKVHLFAEVNIDYLSEEIYMGNNVTSIPTTLFYKNAKLADRLIGTYSYESLIGFINKNLN